MKYKVIRTDTADSLIRRIVLYVAENFGTDIALKKLDYLEKAITQTSHLKNAVTADGFLLNR